VASPRTPAPCVVATPCAPSSAVRPMPAWEPLATGSHAINLEELTQFRRWAGFLPQEACADVEQSAVYVKSRQLGNPKFFEDMRERLLSAIKDCHTLSAAGATLSHPKELAEVLTLVFQAQWAACGFCGAREPYKALGLAKPCVDLVDALSMDHAGLLFWQVLCRSNLGHALLGFKKSDEARKALYKAVELVEKSNTQDAKEHVLLGTCFVHLGRLEWECEAVEESLRYTDMEVELFEQFLSKLLEGPDDQEVHDVVMATTYSFRGSCDASRGKYHGALDWYRKAGECVERHKNLNKDALQVAGQIAESVEQVSDAAHLKGIREDYAATGGPLPF